MTRSWLVFALAFLATSTVLSIRHADFYFSRRVVEYGDTAANALSIRNAGTWHETLGNYSRWHFRHPGPFMFYAQAAGQRLFHDWLPICAGEHNAHAFTSMLLQSSFWAAALAVLSLYLRSPHYLLAIWIAGSIHFNATEHGFISVWPPHTLLAPFFFFCVLAASVARGTFHHAGWLIASGLVLVHNHVAQALPVAVIAGTTLSLAVARQYRTSSTMASLISARRINWALSIAAIAVLMLPLAVDVTRGSASNANAILGHLASHRGSGKSWQESVNFFLQFSRYWGFHDVPAGTVIRSFQEFPATLLSWLLIASIGIWHTMRRDRPQTNGPLDRSFTALLALVFLLTIVCALVWGRRMDGEMYAFNGFYFYAIYFLPLVLASIALVDFCGFQRVPTITLYASAAIIPLILPHRHIMSDLPRGVEIEQAITPAMHETFAQDATRIALFCSPDRWPEATAVANILESRGASVFVPEWWTFVFGSRMRLPLTFPLPSHTKIWCVHTKRLSDLPCREINLGSGALLSELIPIGPTNEGPGAIPLNEIAPILTTGFATDGSLPPWSLGSHGELLLPASPTDLNPVISFQAQSLEGPGNFEPRRVVISAAGSAPIEFSIQGAQTLEVPISRDLWNQAASHLGMVSIRFEFLDPISPHACGINDDMRPLSVSFQTFAIVGQAVQP